MSAHNLPICVGVLDSCLFGPMLPLLDCVYLCLFAYVYETLAALFIEQAGSQLPISIPRSDITTMPK